MLCSYLIHSTRKAVQCKFIKFKQKKDIHPLQARTPLLSISEESTQGTVAPLNLPRYYYSPKLFNWRSMKSRLIDVQDKADVMPVISTSKQDGQPRYCHMCECYKPDRAHHCKDCNACVLKMDQYVIQSELYRIQSLIRL